MPLPVDESVLCRFCAHLANDGLKYRTIKVYLSAVRHLQIAEKGEDPFQIPMAKLEYVLKGIKRKEASQQWGGRERLPITPPLLMRIKSVWESEAGNKDKYMLWAACCLGFFAFLRVGEMTVPKDEAFDPTTHLTVADIAADDTRRPSSLRVQIKQSKTDPFRKGIYLYVGKTGSVLCPVAAMLQYLRLRGMGAGPLFRYKDGRVLTRVRFAAEVKDALRKAGVDQSKYSTHSFRIGAATTAAASGIEDAVIKTLGRWQSLAYLQYVRIPRRQLAQYSRQLAAGSPGAHEAS